MLLIWPTGMCFTLSHVSILICEQTGLVNLGNVCVPVSL